MENNAGKQLLCRLRMIDFSIVETVLFLDAYPDDSEALAYYHKMIEQRKTLVEEYERTVGPLTACGNVSTNCWDWIKQPWPWEYEAN